MPNNSTTTSWLFPPQTREAQFDEKWSFVGKKEKHCDPSRAEDARQGDNWDHVAFDPEHRLVVSVVPGKRSEENVKELLRDFKRRTGGRLMNLLTSDEYAPYKTAIFETYAIEHAQARTGRRGRPKKARKILPKGLKYATVHKVRANGRVVQVTTRVVFGTVLAVLAALRPKNDQCPMSNVQTDRPLVGHWLLVILWSLGNWSLVISRPLH